MAQTKEQQPQQPQQQQQHQSNNKKSNNCPVGSNRSDCNKGTPMIVERVNRIPVINFAISMGFSQYDKLKSSNVTVGDVMTRAESWAFYVWEKVKPIVEKLQDPINKADQLACNTFDYVEDKLNSVRNHEILHKKA